MLPWNHTHTIRLQHCAIPVMAVREGEETLLYTLAEWWRVLGAGFLLDAEGTLVRREGSRRQYVFGCWRVERED